ncbi:nuclear transport factor 2 family protein [Ruegeria pomeroyi]|uniref:Adenylate/guanylate cyclase n=1 Tax=Ruegeria pomeroyi (strain ATCC 700808 / DSM 15171 / DSS-3) TaxID=246200 RepID=Q5LP72_RUEPO|nr:nuclear transport factor 2 family protein [Ruegeria pomeroyi]AAV96216.1 adenylate/guanylate cyclase [Ruegeria pomeroyi DSS-3]NVL01114.1 nuclear transport factor 2 family protein [Ruegeria pomeroyi]QWV09766.1 nuclear transport factor 2 family protein [Ruegeria pomeroyi]
MIQRSPEIEAIVRRWTTLIRSHKVADLPHYLSQSDALVYIGTADGELWRGQLVRDGIADHLAEVPDFIEEDIEIEAYEHGETGWATYQSHYTFPGTGSQGTHRVTFVFVLERGSWKMVQHHISQADSNRDKLGIEHTAFQRLIAAAEAGSHSFATGGLATIMFTDIVDSSAQAAAMGDTDWVRLLDAHFRRIETIVTDHGGTLVKSLGDGTMSSFQSATGALRAARAIRAATGSPDAALALRIGLHTGEVVENRGDFFGTVVNKAARIAAAAGPGEILISEALHLIAGGAPGDALAEPVSLFLKGFEGEHAVFRLAVDE